MTDRFHSLTVVMDHDIREDDAEHIINAIMMLRGVLTVRGNVVDFASQMAEDRAKWELRRKLDEVLR